MTKPLEPQQAWPPRVWIYRVLLENQCYLARGGGSYYVENPAGTSPDSHFQYLSLAEHEYLISDNHVTDLESRVAELESRIERAVKEVRKIWSTSSQCKAHEWEPDTCMTYMRCEHCGIPAHLAALAEDSGSEGEK